MIPSLRNKPYEERLSHLNLFALETRRLRGKQSECFKLSNSFTNVDPTKLFVMDDSTLTRNSGAKLKCRQVNSDCTIFFFTNAAGHEWNRLPPLVVQCNSMASFKNNFDRHFLHLNVSYVSFSVLVEALQLSLRSRTDYLVLALGSAWSGYLCNSM